MGPHAVEGLHTWGGESTALDGVLLSGGGAAAEARWGVSTRIGVCGTFLFDGSGDLGDAVRYYVKRILQGGISGKSHEGVDR